MRNRTEFQVHSRTDEIFIIATVGASAIAGARRLAGAQTRFVPGSNACPSTIRAHTNHPSIASCGLSGPRMQPLSTSYLATRFRQPNTPSTLCTAQDIECGCIRSVDGCFDHSRHIAGREVLPWVRGERTAGQIATFGAATISHVRIAALPARPKDDWLRKTRLGSTRELEKQAVSRELIRVELGVDLLIAQPAPDNDHASLSTPPRRYSPINADRPIVFPILAVPFGERIGPGPERHQLTRRQTA